MNGNTPYGGLPGTAPAGRSYPDQHDDLSVDEKRRLRRDLSRVANQVRTYLSDEFVVGSELVYGLNGLEATVAVQPPIGDAVSAGFSPPTEAEAVDEGYIDESTRNEVARGLAASAVFQVRMAVQDDLTPTAQ